MSAAGFRHVYGPVPSRRLGRSLGIDLVPFKICTFDCVYCQLGRTTEKTLERKPYVDPDAILAELERKLDAGDRPDYISLAGSGEPTLNADIGRLMERIKALTDVPVAVLTNGSLLWRSDVQADLMPADLVLPSLDAGDERLFHYVNRPHRDIAFDRMVEGITAFSRRFPGDVWLEVLLLAGVTGMPIEVKKIAALAARIGASRVQLTTTCRPPAEDFACPLSLKQLEEMKGFFGGKVDLIGPGNGSAGQGTGHLKAQGTDVLALLSRRPCTSEDVARGLDIHLNAALKHLESLVAEGRVNVVATGGRHFYTAEGPPEMKSGQPR